MSDIGTLALVKCEYTDKSGWKIRPGLITGEYLNDYQVMFITKEVGKYRHENTSIIIENKDFAAGGLKHKSLVRTHKTFWIEKSQCKKVGLLKREAVDRILRLNEKYFVRNYYDFAHKPKPFVPGRSPVHVSGRVFGPEEMENLVDSALDFWLTAGRFNDAFEKRFAQFLGVKHVLTINSGSSANLLAVAALTSSKLGEKRLKPGDEVITVAAAFPTTVAPILQYGLIPVFVDVDIPTYNIRPDLIEPAVSAKTRAVMLAHTLGNPFDVNEVMRVARKYDLWVIEDSCDALGSKYIVKSIPSPQAEEGQGEGGSPPSDLRPPCPVEPGPLSGCSTGATSGFCGTFGHLSTFSFYPAHHITMGEGGAVATDDNDLKRILESFRDWGRDCWCATGKDNTCGKRFSQEFGELPYGYDHKYVYSHFGYNLKITDMQAAIGCAQLGKLPAFVETRKRNWRLLRDGLSDLEDRFILPEASPNSDPSWFGFPLTVRENAGFSRDEIVTLLESKGIQTRMLFSGNLIRHPCFDDMRKTKTGFRVAGELKNTDVITNRTFWIGVYPGITEEMIGYAVEQIRGFAER